MCAASVCVRPLHEQGLFHRRSFAVGPTGGLRHVANNYHSEQKNALTTIQYRCLLIPRQ